MDIQTQINKQNELNILLTQNEQLFDQRAEILFSRLQSLLNGSTQMHLLQNIHFPQVIQYVEDTVNKKRKQALVQITDEDDIQREIQMEVIKESQILEEQIRILKQQIEQISKEKTQCQLAQNITANQILCLEDALNKHVFNLDSARQKIERVTVNFAYDELPNGKFTFKKSYKQLVMHFIRRIQDNEQIIKKLQNTIKQKIQKSQQKIMEIEKLKIMQQQYNKTIENINRLKNVCEFEKEQLKSYVGNTNSEIERRLPYEIEKNIRQISVRNQSYERAYHSIYDIVKMVIDNAQLDKVNDYYINKQ